MFFILPEQAKGYLDTIIDKYEDFETLLEKHLGNFDNGNENTLFHFFEKDWRRVQECIPTFQSTLIDNINNSKFQMLGIGKQEKNKKGDEIQYFIVNKKESSE